MKVTCVAGSVVFLASAGVADYELFLLLRFVAGFFIGAVPALALSHINSVSAPHMVSRAAGVFIAGNSVGGLVGRVAAGTVAAQWNWQAGVAAVSVLSGVATLVFVLLLSPGTDQGQCPSKPASVKGWRLLSPYVGHLKNRVQVCTYLTGFLLMGSFVATYNYVGFRVQAAPFNVAPEHTSLLFFGLLVGTVASLLGSKLAHRVGYHGAVQCAAVLILVGIAVTLVPHLWAQICGLLVITAGFFTGQTLASAQASRTARYRTQAGALYTLSYYIGGSLMGWLGGEALARFEWSGFAVFIAVQATMILVLHYFSRNREVNSSHSRYIEQHNLTPGREALKGLQ